MNQHRGVVVARNGMVAASQPLAVTAGLQILQQGGSFADAAVAVSAVLCVTEPHASHLGGDAFILFYDAGTQRTTALNGSGIAPLSVTPECFPEGIPLRGAAAAAVPGLVDAWITLHKAHGRLSLSKVLAPAIAYARSGYPVGYRTAMAFRNGILARQFPDTLQSLTGLNAPPIVGTLLVQHDLANTLEHIANEGRDGFYEGLVAEKIANYCASHGGYISRQDLSQHRTQTSDPISTGYRGYKVYGQPPVSQGHILLQELNISEQFDLNGMGHNSADCIHVMVESKKIGFADRKQYLGDPNFVDIPLNRLLSKEYAAECAAQINLQTASNLSSQKEMTHDTTYFCVADSEGNAASFIQSVFWGYGSGVVVDGTGVLLNNRMTGFSLDPKSPNFLAPGKLTAHTLNAWVVTKPSDSGEKLSAVGGTPGADFQVQTNLQVISNLIDFKFNPQRSIEEPRWQHGPSTEGTGPKDELQIEDRIPLEVCEDLSSRGHAVKRIGAWEHGSTVQVIARHPENGSLLGGSDPRADGHAAGY